MEKETPKDALQIYIGLLPYLKGLTPPGEGTAQAPNASREKLQSLRLKLFSVCSLYNQVYYSLISLKLHPPSPGLKIK